MKEKPGIIQGLYGSLASVRFTILIFLLLAAASLIGTLLPQGMTEAEIHSIYSPFVARVISTFGFADLYHSGWFQLIILLLCVNLVVCSVERLPKIFRLMRHREESITPQKLIKFSVRREIASTLPWEETQTRIDAALSGEFAAARRLPGEGSYSAVAERGRWSPLMVYVVHLGVLLVLVGALAGSLFGFKGFMNIPEGESSGMVTLSTGASMRRLPFVVRCDAFNVSFYDNGMPKDFRSDLGVLENGREVLKQTIRVNDPMEYKGISFYQASYGTTIKKAKVEITDQAGEKTSEVTLPYGALVTIPDTGDRMEISDYQKDLAGFGPALGIVVLKAGEEPSGSWILVKRPEFHGNRVMNYHIRVVDTEESQYTGLQVKKDPGIWLVYLGFTSMLVGIGLAFYLSHRRVWVWAAPSGEAVRIVAAGRANKNSLAFEQEFDRICDRLEASLKADNDGKRQPGK